MQENAVFEFLRFFVAFVVVHKFVTPVRL